VVWRGFGKLKKVVCKGPMKIGKTINLTIFMSFGLDRGEPHPGGFFLFSHFEKKKFMITKKKLQKKSWGETYCFLSSPKNSINRIFNPSLFFWIFSEGIGNPKKFYYLGYRGNLSLYCFKGGFLPLKGFFLVNMKTLNQKKQISFRRISKFSKKIFSGEKKNPCYPKNRIK